MTTPANQHNELKGLLLGLLKTFPLTDIVGRLGDLREDDALTCEQQGGDGETAEQYREEAQTLWSAAAQLGEMKDEVNDGEG